jgi:hypothetical protein
MAKEKFWYLIGSSYEISIFKTKEEAIEAHKKEFAWYTEVREGLYGEEFSGWVGSNTDPVVIERNYDTYAADTAKAKKESGL